MSFGTPDDGRPSRAEIMLDFALSVAKRSTCKRLKVGAVATDLQSVQVYSFGYNGNASGLANTCDSDEPGKCGCVHAETNALIKAPGHARKRLFVTASPCVACAKAILNANVSEVYFENCYRNLDGIATLLQGHVGVIERIVKREELGKPKFLTWDQVLVARARVKGPPL